MSDKEIRDKVLQQLRRSPCIQDTQLDVSVEDAVVTLGGTVWSYSARVAAAEAAHQVQEVRDVANDIVVEVAPRMGRTDTEIAQAVRRMLEWDVCIPDERIPSTVAEGWVTLAGWVERAKEREDAERAVARLAGVQGVINNIRVVHATRLTPGVELVADHLQAEPGV